MANLKCTIEWDNKRIEELRELEEDIETLLYQYLGVSYSIELRSRKDQLIETKISCSDVIDVEEIIPNKEIKNIFPIVLFNKEGEV